MRDTYHHGDLRSSLIATGLRQIEKGSDADLSLRALAKEAGVSPNAPYRHFADKNALMGALAAEGFLRFADAIVAAGNGEPVAALRAQAKAYLEFAIGNPALYRLMFSPYGYTLHSAQCQNQATRAFASLMETAAKAQFQGWNSGVEFGPAVLTFWSALHGWAGIVNDKLAPPAVPMPTIDEWIDAFFQKNGDKSAS